MVNIEPVLYIGISQSFFAGLLISTKKPYTFANRVMAAWLFIFCSEMIFALLNSKVIEMYSFPFITFTYGPLLYLYVSYMTTTDKKFKPVDMKFFYKKSLLYETFEKIGEDGRKVYFGYFIITNRNYLL